MSAEKNVAKGIAGDKSATLGGVLKKNEAIKKNVRKAADEITLVNDVLKQGKTTVGQMKVALTQNEKVEGKVSKAAEDLQRVNIKLAKEIATRQGIETELHDMKADLAGVRNNLVQAQEAGRDAQQLALTDTLTGLPNRASFDQALQHALVQAKRHDWQLAMLVIDVDKFKHINDTHGHDMGDQVLLTVANRLQSFIRDEDMVSRWGGDEFVCLLLDVKETADVKRLAEQLVACVAEDFEYEGLDLQIKISIGVAISPVDGDTAEALFRQADKAMYRAKNSASGVVLSS
ncbi:diguanylate cyclase [Arsukibacterium ikkense]|uniref:Diguanylate cyclase n=1 Tax=Arsukibacterium ikkense TaxID=336831 RepID=A0A0M2V7R1_9GAMM|nr:GGDEF domain-containing protein [Arsukibacterium ikkense]KKO46636.1 diguanylate cyclase [Arsukibacterium ikkense]